MPELIPKFQQRINLKKNKINKKELQRKSNDSCKNFNLQSRSHVNEEKYFSKQTLESHINIKQIESSVDKNDMVYFGDKFHNLQMKKLNRIIIAYLNIN